MNVLNCQPFMLRQNRDAKNETGPTVGHFESPIKECRISLSDYYGTSLGTIEFQGNSEPLKLRCSSRLLRCEFVPHCHYLRYAISCTRCTQCTQHGESLI